MADRAPRTTFIVAADRDALVLEKLAGIEDALGNLAPLLEKIVSQLEAQAQSPAVPLATYEDLYDPIIPGPPEGELVAAVLAEERRPHGWWARLFLRRTTP